MKGCVFSKESKHMAKITDRQRLIYQTWLDNDCKFKPTAKQLNLYPERVRQVVANVKRKLKDD